MAATSNLPGEVPGVDFLQGLFQNPGAGLPAMGAWIAPTLKPEELDKRIQELKTVQFWLEQNAKLLAASIQALEVQRMTLATLQTLNLPLAELGEALKIKPLASAGAGFGAAAAPTPSAAPAEPAAPAPVVDPMQWWGALTRQFGELAAQAVRDAPGAAAKPMAGKPKAKAEAAARPAAKRSPRGAQR